MHIVLKFPLLAFINKSVKIIFRYY